MADHFRSGQQATYQGAIVEVVELLGHSDVVVRAGDDLATVKRCELLPIVDPKKALANTRLMGASDEVWTTASCRAKSLQSVLDCGEGRSSAVRTLALELGLSERHAWRLVKQYEQHRSVSGLIRRTPGRKIGTTVLQLPAERVIAETIDDFYLRRERPTAAQLYERVGALCRERRISIPAKGTVRRRLDRYNNRESQQRRVGSKKAKYAFEPMPGHVDVRRPLERVEIDHSPLDVIARSDDPLCDYVGRPWVTLAIDVCTRCVLGLHIGFDPPSILSVALCLTDAVRKKCPLDEVGVPLDWPMCGIPYEIVVDNGSDFISDAFKRGCEEHNIILTFRPIGSPHYGGTIERLIGTMVGRCHLLPGTTKNSTKAKGDYNSVKHASLTLRQARAWFIEQLLGHYHLSEHRTLRVPPFAAWNRASGGENE